MTQYPGEPQPQGEPPVYGSPGTGAPAGGTPLPPPPPYGQQPYGQPPYGQQNQPPYGQPPHGQPGYGQPGYAPPGYQQPGYGQPGYPPPGGPVPQPAPAVLSQEQKLWATVAHLGGVLAFYPVIHLIPALVIFAVYLKKDAFVRDQAREALNFQIVIMILYIGARILNALPFFPNLILLVWIFSLVFAVLAAISTGKGRPYRYPITYRFIS
jgi:uncharacterized protein